MELFLFESQQITGPFSTGILNRRYSNGEIAGETLARTIHLSEWKPLYTFLRHIKLSKNFLLREEASARQANIQRLREIREQNVQELKKKRGESHQPKKAIPSTHEFRQQPRVKSESDHSIPRVRKISKLELQYAHILGLRGKTTLSDIKKAYRAMMALYHPDKVAHLGCDLRALAEEKSKGINEAFNYFVMKYDSATYNDSKP